jgi:hypothetical protein
MPADAGATIAKLAAETWAAVPALSLLEQCPNLDDELLVVKRTW